MVMDGLQKIKIVTCFLLYQDRLLLLKRSAQLRRYPGKWGAVSGHLENGVSPQEQAFTEILEETGIGKDDLKLLSAGGPLQVVDNDIGVEWVVYPFLFEIINPGTIRLDWEHDSFCWISLNDINRYDTVPGLENTFVYVMKFRQNSKESE